MSGEALPGDPGTTEAARYHAAVAALQGRGRFGIRLGLARVRALLRALGDPQRNLPGALVAGTNGKGSVQAIVASVLRASGSRVAQTPSPHLVTYRERIQIDGRPVAPAGFVDAVERVLAIEAGVARRHGHATEFELLISAAFSWFREAGCELGVIEVGMGGRLDATNAWDGGVAAVTNIDWDHMTYLGSTLEAIAREKAAIIKPGDRAVTGATGAGLAIVRSRCDELGVPLHEVEPLPVAGMDRRGLRVEVPELGEIELGLLGRHQAANLAVALAVLEELAIAGVISVAEASVRAGTRDVRWPGRLELLRLLDGEHAGPIDPAGPSRGRPDLILDGAHNVAGTRALVAAVDELRPSLSAGRVTVLIGLLRDKDVPGIADALLASGSLEGARIIATRVDSPRALPAVELAGALRTAARRRAGIGPWIEAVEGGSDALGEAVSAARDADGPLIVAGSLYLVGAVRERLLDDPELRDPVA